MKNKLTNKTAIFFIFFFCIPFIFEIITFPTSENIICSTLSWFWSVFTIRYFFWKNKEAITVYNSFPLSSSSLVFFACVYFIFTLTFGMFYSMPLNYNLRNGTLPFIIPSLFYLPLILIHFAYRKILFFSRIKNSLTQIWKGLGLFHLPSLKEIYLVSSLGFLIYITIRKTVGVTEIETENSYGGLMAYSVLFLNLMCIPSAILSNGQYNKVYSKKSLFNCYFFFGLLAIIATIYTGSRSIFIKYFISTAVCFSFGFKVSSLFLKKKLFRNISFIALLLILLPLTNSLLGSVAKNRNENRDKRIIEKLQANSVNITKDKERDLDDTEEYIVNDSGVLGRLIFNKVLDNDLYFYNLIPLDLKNHLNLEIKNTLLTSIVPSIFFGSRGAKKDISSTYGSVTDAFRYFATGEGKGSFLEGSKQLEDFLIFEAPTFFILLFIIPILSFCFLDSFVFLGRNHQIVSTIICLPCLTITAFDLFKNSLIFIFRSLVLGIFPSTLIAVLFFGFVRFLMRTFGLNNKNKDLLNQG